MNIQKIRTFNDIIEECFQDAFNFIDNAQPIRYFKDFSSQPFPPSNVYLNKQTKEMTIEVALAGYSENNLNLSWDNDKLKLIIDKENKVDENDYEYIIQKGIKLPNHSEVFWNIDARYFDREKMSADFKDGLLTIKVQPRKEVAPKKIHVFGNLKLDVNKSEKKEIEAGDKEKLEIAS